LSPEETVTFLEDDAEIHMTEDWHKSLLYTNLKKGIQVTLPMSLKEIVVNSKKPPREENSLKAVIEKGIQILVSLLMEMLGTKEDLDRFEERYKVLSPGHAKALMERCLGLISIKKKTEEILKEVILRESIMKNLQVSYHNVKAKVLQVYKLNKSLREKITNWMKDESVPFNIFVFKGKNYLEKISQDLITLQSYLASPHVLYTQY
jgi:predicted nucleic acid-binding OB-fold protein